MTSPERLPLQRLVDESSEVGRVLREALHAQAPLERSEPANWAQVQLAIRRSAFRRRVLLAAGALTACFALALWGLRRPPEEPLSVVAERLAQRPSAAAEPGAAAPQGVPLNKPLDPQSRTNHRNQPGPTRGSAPRTQRPMGIPSASAGSAASAAQDTSGCSVHVRAGNYDAALRCYEEIARGGGMAAEVALYEKARLEARVLGNQQQALNTLNQHQQRFGSGALASEVALSRIELLAATGHAKESQAAIDSALARRVGQERRGDLLALSGDIWRDQGQCAKALEQYRLAEKAGVDPGRLTRRRAACTAARGEETPARSAADATGGSAPGDKPSDAK